MTIYQLATKKTSEELDMERDSYKLIGKNYDKFIENIKLDDDIGDFYSKILRNILKKCLVLTQIKDRLLKC